MVYVKFCGFCALSWNIPQAIPGVYVFTNLENDKRYVGESINVANRIVGHSEGGSPRKFRNALNKYGNGSFLIEPVWYASQIMADKFYQLAVESEFITLFDSIANGYNVILNYHQGKYGEEWGNYLKEFWTDELKVRQAEITRQQFEDPARRALQSKVTLEYLANNPEEAGRYFKEWYANLTPEAKAAFLAKREPIRMAAVAKNNADPEFIVRMVAATHTPEVNAKRNLSLITTYAKPGGKDKLLASRADPDYRSNQSDKGKARFSTEEARQQAREAQAKVADKHRASLKAAWARRPRIWITNGIAEDHHFKDEPIPEGWVRGRISKTKGMRWITDGTINKKIYLTDPMPDGFHLGKHHAKRKVDSKNAWISNGIEEMKWWSSNTPDPVPEGWYRGRKKQLYSSSL